MTYSQIVEQKYWHYPYPLPSESISITSKVGTLKRRRKIRDVLQQFDQGYTDDIFESTPFKKMKRVQVWPYRKMLLVKLEMCVTNFLCQWLWPPHRCKTLVMMNALTRRVMEQNPDPSRPRVRPNGSWGLRLHSPPSCAATSRHQTSKEAWNGKKKATILVKN